jgi:hypothetical protein
MMIFVWLLAAIGAAVTGFSLWVILGEALRAARQGHRIASVHVRHRADEYCRKPSFSLWWRCAKHDLFRVYSETIVGPVAIPHNPNKPMRRYD